MDVGTNKKMYQSFSCLSNTISALDLIDNSAYFSSKGFHCSNYFHHLGVLKELVQVEIFICNAALTCCF
ncbi:hypothetical protein P8452_10069 [Trifolium repens]|nr:hypothetical protein P8452_10069 [Trifolium repens]